MTVNKRNITIAILVAAAAGAAAIHAASLTDDNDSFEVSNAVVVW